MQELEELEGWCLMRLQDLARTIQARRKALGLTQEQLAHMVGLSRQTIVGLERGTLTDLGFQRLERVLSLLGIGFTVSTEKHQHRGLWAAAKSASVSYRHPLSPQMLATALITANIPPGFRPHLSYLLDEVPLELLIRAVEEVAAQGNVKPRIVWAHVARMSQELESTRAALWS